MTDKPMGEAKRQEILRRLAEAAMQAAHHDIDYAEVEAIHEMRVMKREFAKILRGKLKP
mgnify:CR=1 FL=1